MSDFAAFKTTFKRGALITAANWPVVAVQFVAESTFKLLMGVPIVGGALLVAVGVGRDLDDLLSGSAREIVATVAGELMDHPGALVSFVLAFLIIVVGGSTFMFMVKAGTVTVLVEGAARGGALERSPIHLSNIQRASAFSIETFTSGSARFFRRYLRLGLILLAVYAASGGAYLLVVVGAYRLAESTGLMVAWTLLAALASSALIVWITIVNLVYLLTQMVVAVENSSVRQAARMMLSFLHRELRTVTLIFIVVLAFVLLATVASLLATAGLGLISFVPFVGLVVFPLQAAAWLVRGLVFQYLGLTALGAYLALYRPVEAAPAGGVRPAAWARTAS